MHSSTNILQELRIGWRIAVAIVLAQLLGAALLLALGWPGSILLMPDAPAWLVRAWLGAAFATPVGFVLGIMAQRLSGHAASRFFVGVCAVAAVVLPLVGIGLVSA